MNEHDPMLRTERLVLRTWLPEDREAFARLNADPRVCEYLPGPLSREQSDVFADRIEANFAEHRFGLWAVELPGITDFAGFIGLSVPSFEAHFTPCVEVGWRLSPEHWGQGLATEGAGLALRFGFERRALDEIVALTVVENAPSRRVMEKLGMDWSETDDFDHPMLEEGDPLLRHVLYRIRP